jgi:hypothetical protein
MPRNHGTSHDLPDLRETHRLRPRRQRRTLVANTARTSIKGGDFQGDPDGIAWLLLVAGARRWAAPGCAGTPHPSPGTGQANPRRRSSSGYDHTRASAMPAAGAGSTSGGVRSYRGRGSVPQRRTDRCLSQLIWGSTRHLTQGGTGAVAGLCGARSSFVASSIRRPHACGRDWLGRRACWAGRRQDYAQADPLRFSGSSNLRGKDAIFVL